MTATRAQLLREDGDPVAGAEPPMVIEAHAKWPVLQQVEVPIAVKIPLPGMSVRDVQRLQVGAVLPSEWPAAEEVPMYAAGVALSWCEFEVVDGVMAVRLTRLG